MSNTSFDSNTRHAYRLCIFLLPPETPNIFMHLIFPNSQFCLIFFNLWSLCNVKWKICVGI